MMTGGTERHAWVIGNILAWLRRELKGSRCRTYGSEMAVRVNASDIRYPDISIHCHPLPDDLGEQRALPNPTVVIEVLSPSTTTLDQGMKQEEYRAIPSVRTIAFVDPINELVRTVERTGPQGWLDQMFRGDRDLVIPSLGITIPHAEIFARD